MDTSVNFNNIDLYQLLDVTTSASQEEIKKAYRKKALHAHPDKGGSDELFKQITHAYNILNNDEERSEYDNNYEGTMSAPISGILRDSGFRLSDTYKKLIEGWILEFKCSNVINNISSEMYDILNQALSTVKVPITKDKIQNQCDICGTHNEIDHDAKHEAAYRNYITESKTSEWENLLKSYIGDNNYIIPEMVNVPQLPLPKKYNILDERWKEFNCNVSSLSGCVENIVDTDAQNSLETYFISYQDIKNKCKIRGNITANKSLKIGKIISVNFEEVTLSFTDSENSKCEKNIFKVFIRYNNGETKILHLPISKAPTWIPDKEKTTCTCGRSYSIFVRRHHCRGCGEIYCSNCLSHQLIPYLGYNFKVKGCRGCEKIFWFEIANKALDMVRKVNITTKERITYFSLVQYILNKYQISHDDKLKLNNLINEILSTVKLEDFAFGIWYNEQVGITSENWIGLSRIFYNSQEYNKAITCLSRAKPVLDNLANKNKDFYGLLCYIALDLFPQQLIDKVIYWENYEPLYAMLILAYIDINKLVNRKDFIDIGNRMMNEGRGKLAGIFYRIANMNINEWTNIIVSHCDIQQYETATRLLKQANNQLLPKIDWTTIIIKNQACNCLYWIITGKKNDQETWMKNIIDLLNTNNFKDALMCAAFMVLYFRISTWNKEIEKWIGKKRYDYAIVCYRLGEITGCIFTPLIEYAKKLLPIDKVCAFYLFEFLEVNWDQLGDRLFESEKYDDALICYIKGGNIDLMIKKAKILSKLNKSKSYQYYLTVVKNDTSKMIIANIIPKVLAINKRDPPLRKQIIISVLKTFQDPHNNKNALLLHLALAEILSESSFTPIFKNILHTVSKFVIDLPQKDVIRSIYNSMKGKCKHFDITLLYNELKTAVYKFSIEETANVLQRMTFENKLAVETLFKEQSGKSNISELPPHFRSVILIVRSALNRFEGKIKESITDLQEALMCYPIVETIEGISKIMMDKSYREDIFKDFISDLIKFRDSIDGSRSQCFVDLSPPNSLKYKDAIKPTPYIKIIRNYEIAIHQNIKDTLDAAYLYIDMCMAVHDPTSIIGNFIMSSVYFLKAMQSMKGAEIYAYWRLIYTLMIDAFMLTIKHLTPSLQAHVYKIVFEIIMKANEINKNNQKVNQTRSPDDIIYINKNYRLILSELVRNLINSNNISPITCFGLLSCYDTIYADIVGRDFIVKYLEKMANINDEYIPPHLAKYYLFEGSWKEWIPADQFMENRIKCMESLLSQKGWSIDNVRDILNWPLLVRTADGWLSEEKVPLNLEGVLFSSVEGIEINLEAGEIKLLLIAAKDKFEAMFNMQDIQDVLSTGTISSFFTLDQPDADLLSHPFQEMRYAPKNIVMSNYLGTLLHTDYLLKMISTDVEVNSLPPFVMRKASDGFMKRLPKHLAEKVKPVHLRNDGSVNYDQAHRFWIEAGSLPFNEEVDNSTIKFRFGKIKMYVKKHAMKYKSNGELVDDDADEDEKSPEAEFVKDFTDNYDEIGSYFPELLKLKELVKLGGIVALINSMYHYVERIANDISRELEVVKKYLSEIRMQITYPLENDNKISELYQGTLRMNGVSDYQVSWTESNRVKSEIRNNLRNTDDNTVKQVCTAVCQSFSVDSYGLESSIKDWLIYGYQDSLANLVADKIKFVKDMQLKKLQTTISNMNIRIRNKGDEIVDLKNNGECVWVPATFCVNDERKRHRIYGGVNLGLNLDRQNGGINGSGSGGSGGARYVVDMRPDGKCWSTLSARNTITGTTAQAWTGYQATNPNNLTQRYWQPTSGGNIHHTTLHRDGTYNVHHNNGTKTVYK